MFRKILFLILTCMFILSNILQSANKTIKESKTKVGGLKLQDRAFGLFAPASHINQDSTFTEYVNYSARFTLWVGGLTQQGETLVTAGTGNAKTHRPEWTPVHPSFQVNTETGFPQVQKIASLSYSDALAFEGHQPLGLRVDQKLYEFKNTRFAILVFHITLESGASPLKKVYVGFWGDVDAPNQASKKTAGNDLVGIALSGQAPYIYDSTVQGTKIPLLGALLLGVKVPIISWWTAEQDPVEDAQYYAYLKGEAPRPDPNQPADYRFLLSTGPVTLSPGQSLEFPVVLVQAPQLNDFENNLNDAVQFYNEHLGGNKLMKAQGTAPVERTSLTPLPRQFNLYPNFPNPFNPETQIRFDLPEAEHVQLQIYNAVGQWVRTLVDESYPAGTYTVRWDGRDEAGHRLPSGIYIYRIKAGDFQAQRKLLLLK